MSYSIINITNIYTGNIYKVYKQEENIHDYKIKTTYDIELYKENAILLKVCSHGYVDIDNISNYFKYLSIKNYIYDNDSFNMGEFVIPDVYNKNSNIKYYIDSESIKECFIQENGEITYNTIKKLKKEIKK